MLVAVLALAFALPAVAAAAPETFGVNTGADSNGPPPVGVCNGVEECTLRQAIELANENPGVDAISFNAVPPQVHTLVIESPLPEITEAVRIEGDTAPEATAGVPAIELDPIGTGAQEGTGLQIVGTQGTRIEGLAIGGFTTGIEIVPTLTESPVETQICGDYIGTELLGESARKNVVGIEILNEGGRQPEKTEVGGPGCAANVIAGNEVDGIFDAGLETRISENLIGFGPTGNQIPNGTPSNDESAAIWEAEAASGTLIGATEPGGVSNTIWDNKTPGVVVKNAASDVTIRRNSFFENEPKGIEIQTGAPPAPVITSAVSPTEHETIFKGTVEATVPGEEVQLEFFANTDCSKAGEGRTLLGSGAVDNVGPGPTAYEIAVPDAPTPIEHGVTATATHEGGGGTSEFSACASYEGTPQTFVVTTTEELPGPPPCTVSECSLRAAIDAANESATKDTIDFAEGAEGAIPVFGGFTIEEPVEIDGASAPNYGGTPVVELDGSGMTSLGLYLTSAAAGSTIRGLSIGGFEIGIALEGNDQTVCGSYLGVKRDGATALPNGVGVSIEEGTTGDQIGAGCELLGDGNLISSNTTDGIDDFGAESLISGNRIGVGATGLPLANGEGFAGDAGIAIEAASRGALIGPTGMEGGNTISQNLGAGVDVARGPNQASIRANSIFANEGRGIVIGAEAPAPPTITKVIANPASTRVEGEMTAGEFEFPELNFYASAACGAGTEGGQTYLGGGGAFSDQGGEVPFALEFEKAVPAGEEYITATITGETDRQTSEFSECFLSVPATERTFTVNSLGDEESAAGCEAETECTLRGAIEAANETEALDKIHFAESGEGEIEVDGFPLPEITEPLEIDGTSAPNYDGKPVVEIDGTEADNEGPVRGLEVGGVVATIKGLAIGGFSTGGISLGGDHSQVCSNWIGVELDGTSTLANGFGIEVGDEFDQGTENEIGVGCGAGAPPNVIAGNLEWGIRDSGHGTQIGGNLIGVLPGGAAAGNEEGGILVGEEAEGPVIGAIAGEPAPNTISNNDGPGVLVETGTSEAKVRGNSIYANTGRAIEVETSAPPTPEIESVELGAGKLTFEGEANGGDGEEVLSLDFYASAACGEKDGQTYLGSDEVTSDGSPAPYKAELPTAPPAGESFFTVTATGSVLGQTSGFSECLQFVAPPRTFTVNSLGEESTAAGCEAATTCTLRGAIEAADETEALDTIDFNVAGLIEPLTELPHITEPVDIDGTSAPGYVGSPVFEIGGSEQLNHDGGTEGLVIAAGAEGVTIKGLKVTHFDNGIVVDGNRTLIEADTVAHNGDIGVAVESSAPRTAIRRSEIFANGTGTIQFETPNSVPEPELEAFVAGPTSTTLRVPIAGGLPDHEYAIDVYANAKCEKPGEHGPMEVLLGSDSVTTDGSGGGLAEFNGAALSGIDAEAFTVTATDVESGTTGGVGHCTFAPIETTIESKPPALSTSNKATFTFVGETVGQVEGFECSLDSATFEACASPEELTGLSDGPHVFKVRAYNGEGTRDPSPAVYDWTVETAPPEVTITAGPSGTTKAATAKLEFTAIDAGSGVTAIECKLDSGPFEACTSPVEYTGLADGPHTFEVKATNENGNTSTPISRTWTVDTTPPVVAITAGPSGTTKATAAKFEFEANDPGSGVASIECSLDGAAFEACTSPKEYTGLAEGPHTFEVKATDAVGNTSAPVSRVWQIDTGAPEITFESAPPAKTNSTEATFEFTVSDASSEVISVECSLDGAPFERECGPLKKYEGLAAGTHTFTVQAENEAGTTRTVTREWKIVTEAPSPAITTAPPASTETTAATFAFGGVPGAEISAFECSLDGGAFAACTSPQSFTGLAPGAHTFSVRAKDEAGNTSTPTVYRWTVAPAQPPATPPGPEPTNGEEVVVAPSEGKVKIKLPGKNKYVTLTELKEIPVGAVIDATNGRVTLTSIDPNGTEQTAEFFGGVFRVKQVEGKGLVVLELLDSNVCPAPATKGGKGKGASGRATGSSIDFRPAGGGGSSGKLWGSGHGNFRTEGHAGSATVQGTIWLVEDRCNGTTFFRTRRGIVSVRDFLLKKTLPLPAGKTYLAGEK